MLIEHLPPESATWTALRNAIPEEQLAEQAAMGEPEKGQWSSLEHLVALVADRVARVEYTLICANTDKKARPPDPPDPIRRPGARPRKKKAQLTEKSAGRLFELLQGGAA